MSLSLLLASCHASAGASAVHIGEARLLHRTAPATEGEIRSIAAASGTRRSLLAWQTSSNYLAGPRSRLQAALITEDVSRPTKDLLAACGDSRVREKPVIAYNAGHFILVWQEFSKSQDWDIFGTIIEENGKVAQPCGTPIASDVSSQALPTVAAAAGGFLVLWQEADPGQHYRLRASIVDVKGRAQPPEDLIYSKGTEQALTNYAAGWGTPASPYPRSASDQAHVMGGTAQIARAQGNTHVLTWVDEYGWGPGSNGGYTRRFATLNWKGNDQPVVEQVLRSPSYSLGPGSGVLVMQEDVALFATGSVLNRNHNEVAAAAILATPELRFRLNPNSEQLGNINNSWQSEEVVPLFYTPVNVAARLTAMWNAPFWTLIAIGSRAADRPLDRNLYANTLDKNGHTTHSASKAQVIVKNTHSIGLVAVFRSGNTHWLAWSQEDESGLLTELRIAALSIE